MKSTVQKIFRVFTGAFVLQTVMFANLMGQSTVSYDISFENAVHHEAEISVTFAQIPSGVLEVRMSRSSPGRYAIHEFAKNVYNFRAVDGRGNSLSVSRPNPYQWNVAGHDGTIKVTYTLFADRAGGTYAGIDETHSHLNMPAVFMWARGMQENPIEIKFRPQSGWKIATQLKQETGVNTYSAPNLQYFLDSPTELSDFSLREWQVESGGKNYTIQLQVHHDGTEAEIDSYLEMVKDVVAEQKAIFGELPDFDFGRYTFLACYLPYVAGDGMEHRNSTSLTSTRNLRTGATRNLGTVSHEFFHAWNVERIRPKTLEPFNFEQANMSNELWFAEGFTSYYGALVLRRTGVGSEDQYIMDLAGGLNAVINSPGRALFTPVEMSRKAPFVDAARSVDPVNLGNTFISYYTYGSVIGLGLDLTLRSQFSLTLDDYMQAVWKEHGKPEIPYTVPDLERILGDVTGDKQFSADFFRKYVNGHEVLDYKELLSHAGVLVRERNPGQAFLGGTPQFRNGSARLQSYTRMGSPFYNAGLDIGDVILSIDNKAITNANEYRDVLQSHKPGDTVSIQFRSRAGENKTARITFAENKTLEVIMYESASMPVTDAMLRFRSNWLGSQVK